MHLQSRSLLSHRARFARIGSPSKAVENQDFVESQKGQHAAVNAADVDEMAGVNVDTSCMRPLAPAVLRHMVLDEHAFHWDADRCVVESTDVCKTSRSALH